MKRYCLLILCLILSIILFSCNKSDNDNKKELEKTYTVTFVSSEGGYVSGQKVQEVQEGATTTVVKAIPDDGYEFDSWSDGSLDEKKVVENVTGDIELVAKFKKIIYEYPTIYIITENYEEVTSKEYYLNCKVTVDDTKNPEYSFKNASARIKGRGNSTWSRPKKPYRLKFDKKVDLFGHGANKDWTLIANYVDPSQIRNYLAYTLGASFDDLPFTTSTQFASVFMNGEYLGLYLICEQIETGKNRVDIDDTIDNDPSFLIELDYRILDEDATEGKDYFKVDNQPYGIKAPKTDDSSFTTQTCARIKDFVKSCLDTIKNESYEDICNIIDVDSFADGYIIHELFSSIDVNFSSWYMSRDKGGKLRNDPIWDFDISAGNVDYNDQARFNNKLFAVNNTWYKWLLKKPEFRELVKTKLNKYYDMIHGIIDYVIGDVMHYKEYFLDNFKKWPTLGTYTWPNPPEIVEINTWVGQVEYVRYWLFAKLEYMMSYYCK